MSTGSQVVQFQQYESSVINKNVCEHRLRNNVIYHSDTRALAKFSKHLHDPESQIEWKTGSGLTVINALTAES